MLDVTTRTTSFCKMGRTDPYYIKDRSGPHPRSRTNNTEKPKVVAGTFLRKDARSEVVDVNRLAARSLPVSNQISIVEQGGRLCCSDGQTSTALWMKAISISQDCQSSNVILSRTEGGVALTILKSIEPNEPLLMWFAEDVRFLLNLPHLTPEHLSADNKYKCVKCYLHFDDPNPLKIHIALNCNAVDADHLWADLARNFNRIPMKPYNHYPLVPKFEPFNFELSGSPPAMATLRNTSTPIIIPSPPGKSLHVSVKSDSSFTSSLVSLNSSTTSDSSFNGSISSLLSSSTTSDSGLSSSAGSNSSVTPNGSISENSYTNLSNNSPSSSSLKRKSPATITSGQTAPWVVVPTSVHPTKGFHPPSSAFKPYAITPECFSTPPIPPMSHHFSQPPLPMPPGFGQPMSISQMESFVSNLGKSNRGHLCLWCGKMYSRKYGLKIHIRTHTGYKPLKCKYCARPFGDPSNLNKHVRLHAEGDTPYRCDLCGKVMVRRRDLERHMKSRHQENNDRNTDNMSSDEMDDV